ncbi:MAG: IMP dehydrogenase, partial [Eggerthellaceae bacterium]|nr:IMP dehydrogenase [Eggerthellaceae bacterium]
MAYYFEEPSRTFNEYLLVPGYTSEETIPDNVSLRTPLVKYRRGEEEPAISLNIPMVSAIMQAVSDDKMAIALATEGGLSFIYGSQSIADQAAMVARVKDYKAGFVVSDSNLSPDMTLADVVELHKKFGHSTMPVTEGAQPHGKLLGVVTERDYRLSRMSLDEKVADFMTPRDRMIVAPADTSLKEANDIIWDHKLNSLPLVDENDCLLYLVFRKDYDSHKSNPLEMLDEHKRYMVGAGINSRDYAERVPALVEAGADVLCIDSSEGYSVWQKKTIEWIRENYGDTVKVGAGNVVDANQNLVSLVFRKDYDSHKSRPDELLDEHKRYIVGAGINSRDYATRVPLLVEAGADVLCIDSSEGYSEWQKLTLEWIRERYGDTVKVGAGNVVDAEGFRFLADCGADFVKVGIGGGSI